MSAKKRLFCCCDDALQIDCVYLAAPCFELPGSDSACLETVQVPCDAFPGFGSLGEYVFLRDDEDVPPECWYLLEGSEQKPVGGVPIYYPGNPGIDNCFECEPCAALSAQVYQVNWPTFSAIPVGNATTFLAGATNPCDFDPPFGACTHPSEVIDVHYIGDLADPCVWEYQSLGAPTDPEGIGECTHICDQVIPCPFAGGEPEVTYRHDRRIIAHIRAINCGWLLTVVETLYGGILSGCVHEPTDDPYVDCLDGGDPPAPAAGWNDYHGFMGSRTFEYFKAGGTTPIGTYTLTNNPCPSDWDAPATVSVT